MKKAISILLTSLLVINFGVSRVFADGDTFVDFTDLDANDLIDITSDYASNELLFGIERKLVIDSAVSYMLQQQFDVAGTHTIAFTGSYYDNTITAMQSCNSSSYHYQTGTHQVDGAVTVEPAIYGSLSHNSQNLLLNFGVDVSTAVQASETVTTSGFDNTTQACALLGMESGDGAIDGTILLEQGYEKRTITYNDGTLAGHTATFYVPGSESINFSTSDLEAMVEDIYSQVLNNITFDYHYQYDFYLTGSPNIKHSVPEYGYLVSEVYLPLMFGWLSWLGSDSTTWYDNYKVYSDQNNSDHTWYEFNQSFRSNLTDNTYKSNYSKFYWSGTDNPHWYFRSKQFRDIGQLSNGQGGSNSNAGIGNQSDYNSLNQGYTFGSQYFGLSEMYYSVTSNDLVNHPELTAGANLPVGIGFSDIKYYKIQDTSRLNLFNQLGSFLQTQFNRMVSAIGEISGGGSGQDIAQDIENEYNIDVDLDINNSISNLVDKDSNIDLTAPEFTLPSGDSLSLLSDIPSDVIGIFTRNGLGFMIFLPLIIAIVGKVLK